MLVNGGAKSCPFLGCLVSNQRPLLLSLVGWYTVHVSAYLKAFALDGQIFASLVDLYVPV